MDDDKFSQKMLEIMREHLPEQTLGFVQDRLRQADSLEKENKNLVERNHGLMEENARLTDLIAEQNVLKKMALEADEKLAQAKQKEDELEKEMLKVKLASAQDRSNDIFALAQIVFKNPELKKYTDFSLFGAYDGQGHFNPQGGHAESELREKE